MIPFSRLGKVFDHFGHHIYPQSVRESLCHFLQSFLKESKILDLGAGTGVLCTFGYECREDLHYIAVDPAQGMLKYTKPYVETIQAVAEDLPFDSDTFSAIMMGESLHHFKEVDKALSECKRVLKEEGKVFIYDFDKSTFKGKSICFVEKLLGEAGNFFEPNDLKVKLQNYGFSVDITMHSWRYTIVATLKTIN